MKMITNYKGHKLIALDGSLKGRIHIYGPKCNIVIYGGGLEAVMKWIDT